MEGINIDFSLLEDEDRVIAQVLLKNNIATKGDIEAYLNFKKLHDEVGKEYLGKILLRLGYIDEQVTDEFLHEQAKPVLEFTQSLVKDGFLSKDIFNELERLHEKDGGEIMSLVQELNFMTKDQFVRIFTQKMGGLLRLGEWLVFKKKVTNEQVEEAMQIQKATNLSDYLVLKKICKESVIAKVKEKLSSVGWKNKRYPTTGEGGRYKP